MPCFFLTSLWKGFEGEAVVLVVVVVQGWVDPREGIRGEIRNNRYVFFSPRDQSRRRVNAFYRPHPRYLKEDVFTNRPLTVSRHAKQGRVCASFFFFPGG